MKIVKPVATGGIGASVIRKEDERYLRGRGEFVADIKHFGMREVAFVRSPVAHGREVRVTKPLKYENDVFVAGDLDTVDERARGGRVRRGGRRAVPGACS